MAVQQMPSGTHRRGVGDRPYSSYVIFRLNGEDKEVQLGLTHREKDGWVGDNGKEKSGALKVHREAVEWLLGSRPTAQPAKPETPKDLTEKLKESIEAQSSPKSPDSEAAPGEPAPAPKPTPKAPAARKQPAKVS